MTKDLRTLLVVSSTYPASDTDKVPRFVEDQVKTFREIDTSLHIVVLAPHNQASLKAKRRKSEKHITEVRFHYFLPKLERLTDRGIMPALSTSKGYYLLIPFLLIGEFVALYRAVKKYEPDLIYAHWFTPQAINASLVSKLTKTPYVFTTHASDVDVWQRFGWFGKKIVQTFSHSAKAITSVSSRTAEKFYYFFSGEKLSAIKSKVSIIPMGIHFSEINPDRQDSRTILFIGRLSEKKGVQYALPAFKQLLKSFPDARFVIAGDGELKKGLQEQSKELGIDDNIQFAGFVSGAEKAKLLSSAEIMIVPSIITDSGDAEGLPVSLMEGLANQMLCVATTVSGADDIMTDGLDGLLIGQKDSEALAKALEKLLSFSKNEKKRMKNNARKLAKELDWGLIAKQHLDLFRKSLQ